MCQLTPPEEFYDLLAPFAGARLGVAVSGGGDSLALLHMAGLWAKETGSIIQAATVDHGLRAQSGEEAAFVAAACQQMRVAHHILTWDSAPQGNLQSAAREARYRLLTGWAKQQGLCAVLLGHTQDDQAESFLLALARGSGVDGLAAMPARRDAAEMIWLRPLLGVSRAALRAQLSAAAIGWIDDPSNEEERFDRIRLRKAAALLAELGLSGKRLAGTAAQMAQARTVLQAAADAFCAQNMEIGRAGDMVINMKALSALPSETRLRVLADRLRLLGRQTYRPRLKALTSLWTDLRRKADSAGTLHGVLLRRNGNELRLMREFSAVPGPVSASQSVWDGWEWKSAQALPQEAKIGALGDMGLAQIEDWRAAKMDRRALLATPALWCGQQLLAAPLVQQHADHSVRLLLHGH